MVVTKPTMAAAVSLKELMSDRTQREVVSGKVRKVSTPKPLKTLLKSTPLDEDSGSWSSDSYESDEIEVTLDEESEKKDNEVTLAKLRRVGYQRKIWEHKIESFSVILSLLFSYDVLLSAFYGMRTFGAASLLPLVICVSLFGAPIAYLELALGQFTGGNVFTVFSRMSPVLGGIGYVNGLMNFFQIIYDIDLFAMTIAMLREVGTSMNADMAITSCFNPWNNLSCRDLIDPCKGVSAKMGIEYINLQGRCVQARDHVKKLARDIDAQPVRNRAAGFHFLVTQLTGADAHGNHSERWPSEEMLVYTSIGLLCMFLMANMSNKGAVRVCVFPLLLLFVLFSAQAILQVISPLEQMIALPIEWNTSIYRSSDVWTWALIHTVMLLKIGQGPLITLGAMHEFHNNILIDTLLLCLVGVSIPYLLSMSVVIMQDQMLGNIVGWDFNSYQKHKTAFWVAHQHSQYAIWGDALLSFFFYPSNNFLFGLLFCLLAFFLYLSSKIVRLECVLVSTVEYFEMCSLGGKRIISGLLLMMGFIFHKMWTPNRRIGVYSLYLAAGVGLFYEITGILILYGPRRLFSNFNLLMFGVGQSKSRMKERIRHALYLVNVLITFLVCMAPLVSMMMVVLCVAHMKVSSLLAAIIGFSIYLLLVPAYGVIRVYAAWRGRRPMIREFELNRELWGPRETADRAKAEYVDKQLRV